MALPSTRPASVAAAWSPAARSPLPLSRGLVGPCCPRQLTIPASAPANRRTTSPRIHCLGACDITLASLASRR